MGKQAKPRALADSEAKSVLRNLRISPQKLNLVAEMIRGMDANRAIAALTFSRRRVAGEVKKALQSAIANAENNHSLDVDARVSIVNSLLLRMKTVNAHIDQNSMEWAAAWPEDRAATYINAAISMY